jgi:hypothetical protein
VPAGSCKEAVQDEPVIFQPQALLLLKPEDKLVTVPRNPFPEAVMTFDPVLMLPMGANPFTMFVVMALHPNFPAIMGRGKRIFLQRMLCPDAHINGCEY